MISDPGQEVDGIPVGIAIWATLANDVAEYQLADMHIAGSRGVPRGLAIVARLSAAHGVPLPFGDTRLRRESRSTPSVEHHGAATRARRRIPRQSRLGRDLLWASPVQAAASILERPIPARSSP